jgi:hypothetical protein
VSGDPDGGFVNGEVLDTAHVNSYVVGVEYDEPGEAPADTAPAAAPEPASPLDPSDGTVDEVNAYLAEHPEDADRVLAAERAGKARVGVLGDDDED